MYGTVDRDSPIDLLSITRYMADTISIWDILAELVLLTAEPPPANPFDIDHTYLDNLSSVEQVIFTRFPGFEVWRHSDLKIKESCYQLSSELRSLEYFTSCYRE